MKEPDNLKVKFTNLAKKIKHEWFMFIPKTRYTRKKRSSLKLAAEILNSVEMGCVGVASLTSSSPYRVFIGTYKPYNSSSGVARRTATATTRAESMAIEKLGIKIEKNPPESKLTELGVRNWPKWGCPPSKFPWTYDAKETCFLLEGKVKVYPDGSDEGVEIGAGDLVVFPKGMSCTWDVSVAVDKHYKFE